MNSLEESVIPMGQKVKTEEKLEEKLLLGRNLPNPLVYNIPLLVETVKSLSVRLPVRDER